MKAIRAQDPERTVVPWGRITPAWPRPLQFIPVNPGNRKLFWAMVMSKELVRWEQLDDAILGVGQVGDGPLVTVYSFRKAQHQLSYILEAGQPNWTDIQEFFRQNLLINIGPKTPFFLL